MIFVKVKQYQIVLRAAQTLDGLISFKKSCLMLDPKFTPSFKKSYIQAYKENHSLRLLHKILKLTSKNSQQPETFLKIVSDAGVFQ